MTISLSSPGRRMPDQLMPAGSVSDPVAKLSAGAGFRPRWLRIRWWPMIELLAATRGDRRWRLYTDGIGADAEIRLLSPRGREWRVLLRHGFERGIWIQELQP